MGERYGGTGEGAKAVAGRHTTCLEHVPTLSLRSMLVELTRTVAAILAGGMALAGLMVGGNFSKIKQGDRYVDVKGVAERDAKADMALWPLRVAAAGNDLSAVQDTIVQETRAVL